MSFRTDTRSTDASPCRDSATMVEFARKNKKSVYTPSLEMEDEINLTSGQYLASGGLINSRRYILLKTLRAHICSCCHRSSTRLLLPVTTILVLLVVSLTLFLPSHHNAGDQGVLTEPREPATVIEHDDPREVDIINKLHNISGKSIYKQGSPQYNAANWLLKKDNMTTRSTDSFLEQRYILAILFFQRDDNSAKNWETWLNVAGSECFWIGVDCDNGRVTSIQLDDHDLTGTIPIEIGRLEHLKKLDLSFNKLIGTIPPELGALNNLESLKLNDNELIGAVPPELCLLRESQLLSVFIANCEIKVQKLSCDCCTDCVKGSNDDDVSIINDKEKGSLTGDSDSNRKTLIYGSCTKISGKAVFTNGSPQNLAMNWMINNDESMLGVETYFFLQRYVMAVLYYSLCEETWSFDSWLSPSKNECFFQGVTCNAKQIITKLTFAKTGMVGTLPNEISKLVEVTSIDFSQNKISGGIPSSWKSLSNLITLDVRGNEIVGPMVLCNLYFENHLKSVEVDCDKISCECCAKCSSIDMNVHIKSPKDGTPPNRPSKAGMPPVQNSGHSETTSIGNIRPSENIKPSENITPNHINNGGISIPSADGREKEIRQELQKVSKIPGYLPNENRTRAQNWIIHDDSQKLSSAYEDSQILPVTSQYLKERYILTVFYFVLDGSNWKSMSNIEKLTNVKNTEWLNKDHVCHWGGITCDMDGFVTGIELPFQNLHGTLPYEIAQLWHLHSLDLSSNHITRAIPREFGQMSLLTNLVLNNNQMSGNVPYNVCMLREQGNLDELWVDCDPNDEYRVTCSQNGERCCTRCERHKRF